MSSYSFTKIFHYLPCFIKFVFRNFPAAYAALTVTVLGVAMEYAALSAMIPLSNDGRGGSATSARVTEIWHGFIAEVGLPDGARTWLWMFLLLFGIRIAIGLAQISLNTYVAKQILAYLSSSAFSRVVSDVPMSEIYKRSIGHYMALGGDESNRAGQLFFYLAQTISALLAASIGLAVLYLFSTQVFEFTMLFLVVCGVVLGLLMRTVFALSAESGLLSREVNTTFIEALNGLRSIRSMAGENYVRERYNSLIYRYAKVLLTLDVSNHSTRTLPGLILLAAALVVLFPGTAMLGDMSAVYFFTITTMLIRVLSFLGTAVGSAGHVAVDMRVVFEMDDILGKNDASGTEHRGEAITRVRNIIFSNLDCGYRANHKILSGVSAEVKAGRSYAVVGKSGSGKSTLADVFLGLLFPLQGELLIDGVSYEQLNMDTLRKHVVLVEQQTRIFSGSLRENITFGLQVSKEELQVAIELAGLSEFVEGLPSGLETSLDYQGANLSGGQRQRVGLARALVRQPDVLILDEATSALDGHTRDVIVNKLHEAFRDRILIFITHDETISHMADEVWCIENGLLEVVEKEAL
jgi:ATP-binding cassette subfamily B protein